MVSNRPMETTDLLLLKEAVIGMLMLQVIRLAAVSSWTTTKSRFKGRV